MMEARGPRSAWCMRADQREGLAAIAETDRIFLAESYGLDLGAMAMPTSSVEDAYGATSDLLAKTLMRMVSEGWAPRVVMASRLIAQSTLARIRHVAAR